MLVRCAKDAKRAGSPPLVFDLVTMVSICHLHVCIDLFKAESVEGRERRRREVHLKKFN